MARSDQAGDAIGLQVAHESRPERADAARNRRLLLQAAAEIVRDQGIEALTMEAVASAAGVGIGTVYRRFGDRHGLAYALIDDQEREFQNAFLTGPPPLGPGAPPADRLRAYVNRYVDRLSTQGVLMATAEGLRYQAGAYRLQRLHIATLIRQIDPDLDAFYLAEALLEVLSGKLFQHQTTDEDMSAERIKAGLDQLLRGIIS